MSRFFVLKPFDQPQCWASIPVKSVAIADAEGGVLAEDVYCREDVPGYDCAVRDGWAVKSSDEKLDRVISAKTVENGCVPDPIASHDAVWVNTGGMIPEGADAVIAAADIHDTIVAVRPVAPGNFVMKRGTEWRKGDLVLAKGENIGVREMAMLVENGIETVRVQIRPSVGIVATGSELHEAMDSGEKTGGPLGLGMRRSSDAYYLKALLTSFGVSKVKVRVVRDHAEDIGDEIRRLAAISDVIVTIGGTGRGAKDLTRSAIELAGGTLVDGAALGSGSLPFIAGKIGRKPVVGLPGHPLGAIVISQRVLMPLLWSRYHHEPYEFHEVKAVFSADTDEPLTGELCVELRKENGGWIATPVEKGTGRSKVFRDVRGIVRVNDEMLRKGRVVTVECFVN